MSEEDVQTLLETARFLSAERGLDQNEVHVFVRSYRERIWDIYDRLDERVAAAPQDEEGRRALTAVRGIWHYLRWTVLPEEV